MTEREKSLNEAEALVRRILSRSDSGNIDETKIKSAAVKIARAVPSRLRKHELTSA